MYTDIRLFDLSRRDSSAAVRFLFEGAELKLPEGWITFGRESCFDMLPHTMELLNERLVRAEASPILESGCTLRQEFEAEYRHYRRHAERVFPAAMHYGVLAYYPTRRHVVRYAPARWHRLALIATAGSLYQHACESWSWEKIQETLASTVVAVAGCSVGSSVIHALAMDLRPRAIKIADRSRYKLENMNRVRVGYAEFIAPGWNNLEPNFKAPTVKEQLLAIDPFMQIFTYEQGVDERAINGFLGGNSTEPKVQVVVDEIDDPRIKILLRAKARERRLPLIMVTDIGSAVQLDVRRFDLDPTLTLTHAAADDVLYRTCEAALANPSDRSAFFAFVDALIGTAYRRDELGAILNGSLPRPSETMFPQLGSTVAVAGGLAAETIARLRLGYEYPARALFNKRSLSVSRW